MSKYCRKCGVQLYGDFLRYALNNYMREQHDDQCKECNPESYLADRCTKEELKTFRKELDRFGEVT